MPSTEALEEGVPDQSVMKIRSKPAFSLPLLPLAEGKFQGLADVALNMGYRDAWRQPERR
jgi:hypothetical protein